MAKSPKSLCCGTVSENTSVSIRKIENGYIVSESSYGPKGYSSKEVFSAEKPKLVAQTQGSGKTAPKTSSALGKAVKSLQRK